MVLALLLPLLTLHVLLQDTARRSALEAAEISQSGEWVPVSEVRAGERCLRSRELEGLKAGQGERVLRGRVPDTAAARVSQGNAGLLHQQRRPSSCVGKPQ